MHSTLLGLFVAAPTLLRPLPAQDAAGQAPVGPAAAGAKPSGVRLESSSRNWKRSGRKATWELAPGWETGFERTAPTGVTAKEE